MFIHHSFCRLQNQRRGSALVMAIIFTAIMAMVAVISYKSTMFQTRMAARSEYYLDALAIAEAGAELAMVELNRPAASTPAAWTNWAGSTERTHLETITDDVENPMGEVDVIVSALDTKNPIIKATGYIPSKANAVVSRTVQVVTENDTVPSPFGSFGIFGFQSVTMNGSQVVDSYNAVTGTYGGSNANIGSNGNIKFGGSSVIHGNVQAGGTIKAPGASVISGDVIENSKPTPPPPLPKPEYDPEPPPSDNNNQIIWKDMFGNLQTVPSNGNINVNGIGDVTFPAPGVYYLNSVSFNGVSNFSVLGDGDVKIYVTDSFNMNGAKNVTLQGDSNVTIIAPNVDFQGSGSFEINGGADLTVIAENAKMAGARTMQLGTGSNATFYVEEGLTINGSSSLNAGGQPSQLQIFAENDVTFNGSSTYHGGIYAPNADLTLNGAATWYGAMIAKEITVNGASGVHVEEDILAPSGGDGTYVNSWLEVKAGS